MYKNCQSAQSARRQRAIEHALLNLMLRRRYEDISVSDLCNSIQLPRRAFYRYFSDKNGALYALIDHTLTDFFDAAPTLTQNRGSAVADLEHTFTYWMNKKALLDALERSSLSGILAQRAVAFSLQEGHMPRQFKQFFPEAQALAITFSVCGLMAMILQWHKQGFVLSPAEITRLTITLLANPLLPGQ